MKRLLPAIIALAAVLPSVHVGIAVAQNRPLTCQVYGGSFVLEDNDFKAMKDSYADVKESPPAGKPVTSETFPSLTPASKSTICQTRMLARRLKSGKIDYCDFAPRGHYNYAPRFLDDGEVGLLNDAMGLSLSGKPGLPVKQCR
jgi:hypothetical protein